MIIISGVVLFGGWKNFHRLENMLWYGMLWYGMVWYVLTECALHVRG